MWQAVEVRTYPLTLVLEWWGVFSRAHSPPREFPQPQRSPFPAPVPLLFVAITASPREWWFLLCQQLLPPLSLHIQDVSFRKHEPVPPVWLLFAFIQLQWANSYLLPMVDQLKFRGSQCEQYWHLCVCFSVSLLCFSSCNFFFSAGMSEGGLYFEAVYYWCQACDILYKMRICCSKLPGEFTREPCLKRKALFSYPVGPNSCFVVLICGTEGPEALFNGLAAVRTFSLFSNDHREPLLHPLRERLQIYTGSPVLGKPLTKPPPMAVSNCHYYCIR